MTSRKIGNFRFRVGNIPDEPIDIIIPESKDAVKD